MPHSFGDQYPFANFVTEVIAHPIKRKPAEVKFYTNTLRYNRAYWVTIDRLTRHNADALVTATYKDDAIRVTTTNIDALTLRLADRARAEGQAHRRWSSMAARWRRTRCPMWCISRSSPASGRSANGSPDGRVKRHGVQGPIGDAFNSRFLAVYGDGDRDLAIAELDAIRNPPGPLDIHGDFPMKAASKVTREDIESSNLILFGTPKSNAVLKRIAESLPAELLDGASDLRLSEPGERRPATWWSGARSCSARPIRACTPAGSCRSTCCPITSRSRTAGWLRAGISTTSGSCR